MNKITNAWYKSNSLLRLAILSFAVSLPLIAFNSAVILVIFDIFNIKFNSSITLNFCIPFLIGLICQLIADKLVKKYLRKYYETVVIEHVKY